MSVRSARLLSGLLAGAAVTHLAVPEPYDAIVPRSLPGSPRGWTNGSAAAELALAAALLAPATRRPAALLTAGFFVAVFPANVTMAYRWRRRHPALRAVAYSRLPAQLPLVLWALKVAREASAQD
ncbi:hypothetical protein [Streptomyces sp. NPDC021020]|uniref:hypothetical protein n=1 Tax=Streptomyces sp. NPDC021020 TaxID=3365109 RepID=UPI0037A8BAAD